MVSLKPDADQIRNVLNALAEDKWIKRTERRWWPRFVFHYTDIRNAVQVLQEGYLYSRKYLEDEGKLVVSSGSPSVLASTNIAIKDCVRLYFRPKTPTQYCAEGICSQVTLSESKFRDAHCPVPVFFLFDSATVLARSDCWFSDGNLASRRAHTLSTASELEQLPWKKIYHTSWIDHSQPESSDIVFRRHAEVIVPRKLDLSALRYIYCRSEAERETLLHLLPPDLQKRYQNKIFASTRSSLFYRRQTFVETVRLSSRAASFRFSPETKSPGPFHLQVELEIASSQHSLNAESFNLKRPYILEIPLPSSSTGYTIRLCLDEHLAYANTYEEMEIPF
jgi:hypothetical protein